MEDREIDIIYSWVDARFRAGEFEVVNALLAILSPERMDIDELLSWLTITLSAKSKLPARNEFFVCLHQKADGNEGLWRGLG